jgi:hypothetical protein
LPENSSLPPTPWSKAKHDIRRRYLTDKTVAGPAPSAQNSFCYFVATAHPGKTDE